MIIFRKIFGSSVGRKSLMAVSGLALVLFLFAHLAGNLLMFAGQQAMNEYAQGLKDLGPLLWIARGGLLSVFLLHLYLGITLTIENRKARPEPYAYKKTIQASAASRSMIITGMVILVFLLFHLAHYTLGWVDPDSFARTDVDNMHDVYNMVIVGFQNVPYSIFYIVSMLVLSVHLSHGIPSLFQSVGWNNPSTDKVFKRIGMTIAAILFLGFTSIPTAVMLNILRMQ